jgi:hypothetical protein
VEDKEGRRKGGRTSDREDGKGMRKKMSTVLWRIERSRDVSPEPIKSMLQNGLEAMVSAVEEAMIGISNGMVEERKKKEQV